ncbi:MAG: iron-sulfur cluster insertion protein ErpA [Bacteroidota bacterium]|nr:iron-sulfur cluster insertion protein ErpA [Bacteroidota bacterium]MDP4234667.1 iron-sulfur cluster insertion protein ErpA [Bacteroidota bacterium]MDP4243832.1 iron-sulfur cluster insertion protein ErpA [Bacteroidota bacterium]MDP4288577.1 iron-sulfur cluster insertion protein ErpA [Bacteroidota bacterium]
MPSLEETTVEKAFENIESEISLTEKAASEVRKIMEANKIPETYGLRVGVKGGGCSGLSYSLGFDSEQRENDRLLSIDGIRLFVDPKSLFYLAGTQLDFTDGLNGRGFVFNNPNASKTCGCGSSFGA